MDIQIALAAALLLGGFRGFDCIFWRILEQLKNIPEMKLSSLVMKKRLYKDSNLTCN